VTESGREKRKLTLLSYNIHGGVGCDDRLDVDRIAGILREQEADIIGLQEVRNLPELPGAVPPQLRYLAAALGMEAISGPTLNSAKGDYGNALLTRHAPLEIRRLDLSFPEREPRGALDVDFDLPGGRIRLIVTHLGLRPAERRYQVRRLVEAAAGREDCPVVLMGDLNEWFPPGRPARWLHRHFSRGPAPPTFPSAFPLFALDRILVRPPAALVELRVLRSPQARIASDHLPLRATIALT
jgi:endonuclease/exonuclease/phosphatase family metal-dependent hydrolase